MPTCFVSVMLLRWVHHRYLATAPELEKVSGKYFDYDCSEKG